MSFRKQGSVLAAVNHTSVDDWNQFKTTAEIKNNSSSMIIANLDQDAVYLHGTILASVDLEKGSKYLITPDTEKYINDNGDSFPRDEVMKRFGTFKTNAKTYVEHNQGPENAKGKCLDVVARDMGDTVLIDVLFTIDAEHKNLIKNVRKGYVTHLSMGCQTEFTVCSICGNIAHNEEEYCTHIKSSKKKVIKADDGKMRKVAELCYNNTWIDVSLVMNPAFGGAAIRQILSTDDMGKKVIASLLEKNMDHINSNKEYETYILKAASQIAKKVSNVEDVNRIREDIDSPAYEPYHPINNSTSDDNYPPTGFEPIPWDDKYDVKDDFDEDNPQNESRVEGPIFDLENTAGWECYKCSNTLNQIKKASNSLIIKCSKCGYLEEINDFQKFACNSRSADIVENIINDIVGKKISHKSYSKIKDQLKTAESKNLNQIIYSFAKENNLSFNLDSLIKNSARKQVLDIVKEISNNITSKIVPKEIIKKFSEGYQFLEKEVVDELRRQGFRLASTTNFKSTVERKPTPIGTMKQAFRLLEEYETSDELRTASQIIKSHGLDNSTLEKAIKVFSNEEESERYIDAAISELSKMAFNEDNVEMGLQLYIDKIYKKWNKNDISELIREQFPHQDAKAILDEARKLNFR